MYHDERKEVMPEAPVAVPLEPWRQHLLKAAEYLRVWGWCQGTGRMGDRRCVQGAITEVIEARPVGVRLTPKAKSAFDTANSNLAFYLGLPATHGMYIATAVWNDIPNRTKEQVIAALEGAAGA